jgi:DNA-directed RNA polymerase subunit RPC12/RpoP
MDQVVCVDCSAKSPETKTDQTLVSMLGWRIHRQKTASGAYVVEWRCPACWKRFKEAQAAASGTKPK